LVINGGINKMKKVLLYSIIGLAIIFIAGIISFQYSRSWERSLFIDPIHRINIDEKVIALTFDDGPSEIRTPALLDLLSKHNVKATFFMLGKNIEKYPDIAQAVFNQGHLIGNHSYDHPRLVFKSPSFVTDQILKTEELIKEIGQEKVIYFRPPYSSKYIVLPLVLKAMDKKLVTGTYDPPSQYKSPFSAEEVANEVIKNAQPGSIIFLHDGKDSDKDQFVESIELIIIELRDQGYNFVRLDFLN